MDTIEIASLTLDGVRLDFPSERQMTALASAWDDDTNHQISFLGAADFRAAQRTSEYASMIASADLVLAKSEMISRRAANFVEAANFIEATSDAGTAGKADAKNARAGGIRKRSIPIGARRVEYLSCLRPPEEEEVSIHPYLPLKTLAVFLSALEQRRGSVFLVGGNIANLQRAEGNLRSTFPELRVVGRATGDYGGEDEMVVMRALQKAAPDMIIVGMPLRGEELWIPRHMRYTRAGIFFYERAIMETLAGRH